MIRSDTRTKGNWAGRFSQTPLTGLLYVNRRHHFAESTSRDLTIGDVLDLVGDANEFRDIPLGYGPSAASLSCVRSSPRALALPTIG
jgi:hypothetical protein